MIDTDLTAAAAAIDEHRPDVASEIVVSGR